MHINQLSSIDHIVVLMLENRSFDEMLGLLYSARGNVSPSGQPFEGLTGHESNPGTGGKAVPVFTIAPTDPYAYFMPGADPGEGYKATNSQLFGSTTAPTPPVATNDGFVADFSYTLGWESKEGWSILPGTTANSIMGVFPPSMLPVLSGLASGFAVCDHWFSSAPTETLPNRAFVNAGTSQGRLNDDTTPYTCPSIFGLLSDHKVTWSIYGYNEPPLTRGDFTDTTNADDSHFGEFTDFTAAAAKGTLAGYTFLEPSWDASGNSQHPNYNVALGEQLLHDVYYALRNGPGWNRTLLIITYDEHGGCYDHVPPPSGATPPDNSVGQYGFDFKRFGVRVPTVLVSPLIPAGTVFRVAGTPLDHTSILKTIETRWNLPALTARDAAANGVGAALILTKPRKDDPLHGVIVPVATGQNPDEDRPSHLQEVHAALVAQLPVVDKEGGTHHAMPLLKTNRDYKVYIRARTSAWRNSRRVVKPS
ncbi:MAG TPA: alkaline phosphatase family protein [Bryobacteraceae bacterium]